MSEKPKGPSKAVKPDGRLAGRRVCGDHRPLRRLHLVLSDRSRRHGVYRRPHGGRGYYRWRRPVAPGTKPAPPVGGVTFVS